MPAQRRAGGAFKVVDHSDAGRCEDLAWSADGRWLAYSYQVTARQRAIKLCELATLQCSLVTHPEFRDYSPSFDPKGKFLYFLSLRTYDPVYDSVQFEMSFPRAARPYLVALQAGGPPPFEREPKGLKAEDKGEDKDEAAATKEAQAPALHIDLEGIAQRIAAFPVDESRFGKLAAAAQGKVVWTVLPIEGQQGRGGHKESTGRLEAFDFDTQRVDTLMERCDDFYIAGDHSTLVVRDGKRLRAIAVDHRESRRTDGADNDAPSRKSGWIDLSRIRVSVLPRARMGTDAARGVAPAARPFLGGRHVRDRLAGHAAPLRAAARRRGHARRAVRPDLGAAGRTRHLARLRIRR